MKTQTRLLGLTGLLIAIAGTLTPSSVLGAAAQPASAIKIEDKSTLAKVGKRWYLRGDFSTDIPGQGAQGFDFGAGYRFNWFWGELGFAYYSTRYGALNIHQTDTELFNDDPASPNSEISRRRKAEDPGSIISFGPSIGASFKLFKSDHFIEMGRFGVAYAEYTEPVFNFRGALAQFHGALGYQLDPVILSAGISWNLGYMQRVASSSGPANDIEHNNFLPIQWWAFQFGLLVWIY